MRVCLVYDCLHPWTVGGYERWLRRLAESLVQAGHEVTYLTRQQWADASPPDLPGVRVVAVSRAEQLYDEAGNRHPGQALRFARGVAGHLLRHRAAYDVVHTCAFPFFHLPALRAALAGTGTPVVVDWVEVWSARYWRQYSGGVRGTAAWLLQALCARLSQHAVVFSDLHAARLRALGPEVLRVGGLGPDPVAEPPALAPPDPPHVVWAGRHVRDKRPVLAVRALQRAGLPGTVFGDGPEHAAAQAAAADPSDAAATTPAVPVALPGFVPAAQLAAAVRGASCLLHTSSREGFGIVVLEAAAVGTPVVVVAGPDNAAVELVEDGVNGVVARQATPAAVAAAVQAAVAGGRALRESTAAWYAEHADALSADAAARRVQALHRQLVSQREARAR